MTSEATPRGVGSNEGLDFTKFAAMAKAFRDRDEFSVNELNAHIAAHGVTLEARLSFAEDRLHDTAGVLAAALELLGRMKANVELSGARADEDGAN